MKQRRSSRRLRQRQPARDIQRHDEKILNAILTEGHLASYSVVDEVKLLLLFLSKRVLPRYDNYASIHDIEYARDYLDKRASRAQLLRRERDALAKLTTLEGTDRALQELTALFLNPHFLDGTEQNEDLGGFLYLLSKVEPTLCDEFCEFTRSL